MTDRLGQSAHARQQSCAELLDAARQGNGLTQVGDAVGVRGLAARMRLSVQG